MGAVGFLVKYAVLTLLTAIVFQIVLNLDLTKKVYNHQPGACKLVDPIVDGSEDIELLPNGLAVVSSGLRYLLVPELANVVGKLFLYDLKTNNPKPTAIELKIIPGQLDVRTFNPHGLSSHVDSKGVTTLYVINHVNGSHSVELFQLDTEKHTAKHLKTIRDALLFNPNDLVVVGPEQFYVSNNRYFDNSIMQLVEISLNQVALCNIVYYNKGKATAADHWLRGPNGLTTDKDKKFLFAAIDKQIVVYKINTDASLTRLQTVDMYTHCDNLFFDAESNSLYSGCHPVAHEILAHLYHPKTATAPTQVLKIEFTNGYKGHSIKEIYANDGKDISAGTIAIKYKNQILIGSVAHKTLLCDLSTK
jgi:arylesterase/paraoxonase